MSSALHASNPIRTRKPRGQGASRRGEILAAATRIFVEEGIAGATMRRIAAAVGVSPTALYVYFPDKEAILQAIAEATFADLLAALEASQVQPGSVVDRLRAGMRAYIAFGLANPDAYRLTFTSAPRAPSGSCHGRGADFEIPAADHSFAILEHGVEDMIAAGHFRPGPVEAIAETICACLTGITTLLLSKGCMLTTDPTELAERTMDLVIAGLR